MLVVQARLVRLEVLLRLRGFGFWPWFMLSAWCLFAAGQEPIVLRDFGIHIGAHGAWSGATILLLALAASGRESVDTGSYGLVLRNSVTSLVVVAVLLAVVVGAAQAALAMAAGLVAGHGAAPLAAVSSAAGFALAHAPASVGGVLLAPLWGSSIAARLGLGIAVVFSLGLSAVWFSDPGVGTAGASALAAAGAVFCALLASPANVNRT